MTVKEKKRLRYGLYFFLPVMLLLLIPVKLPFTISAKAITYPLQEWQLGKTSEGNLVSNYKDHRKGTLETYSVTEFQRGDVVTFELNEDLKHKSFIREGDTIGIYNSNEELRKLIELQGTLGILEAELEFYTTGQKPEDVDEALHRLKLARQELATEKKLISRSRLLHRDSVISDQEFEIAENRYRVKEINLDIAEARYRSITTGEKPEQELLLRAKIKATKDQLSQVEERLESLVLRSPFSGMVIHQHGNSSNRVMALADTTSIVAVCGFQSKDRPYILVGQKVFAKYGPHKIEGRIINVDNTMQVIEGRSAFFARAEFPAGKIPPGAVLEVDVFIEDLQFFSYLGRYFGVR
ncbi:MAG: hypothetical protein EA358_04390 [Flavobacteriales bacterium]|nr:MAG: hypothetical protein EA358_04390 [Flavobacteriales bacterium]